MPLETCGEEGTNVTAETSERWKGPVREYLETWAAAFADVLQQVAAAGCRAALVEEEAESAVAVEAAQGGLEVRFDCSGKLAGGQTLAVSVADAVVLGRLLTGETGDLPGELRDDERDAATELVRQVAGMAAGRWKQRAGDEVRFDERKQDPEEWKPLPPGTIRLEGAAAEPLHVVFEVDETLAAALSDGPSPEATAGPEKQGRPSGPQESSNLNLLLDIELDASIRFGQKELLLKDVLNLRPGTVVELARRVNEPAELLVAGKLMARGEVVVVEGNYGLRITEILGPAERLAVLQG